MQLPFLTARGVTLLASIGSRRSNIEIIVSILEACRCDTCKTRVMYKCKLSFRQLEGYLQLLLKARLLTIENNKRSLMFRVSSKGKNFVEAYHTMKTMIENPV